MIVNRTAALGSLAVHIVNRTAELDSLAVCTVNRITAHGSLTVRIVNRTAAKENRISIRVEFTRKKCKTAILLYCFQTAGVLNIFVLYNNWALGHHFIETLKLILKETQIMK